MTKNIGHQWDEKPTLSMVCLHCRKGFLSFGLHNRICDNCKASEDHDDYGFSPPRYLRG